jgi:hypothetical protein
MQTPSRMPYKELTQAIAKNVEEYIREVRRLRRAEIRASITERAPDEEPLTLDLDEIETYVDIIEARVTVADYDLDTINQLTHELGSSPDGPVTTDQFLQRLESRQVKPPPELTDDAILDQYHFTVTGTISTRCQNCRRGRRWTAHEFMHPVILRRLLLYPAPCPDCHTGHIKVYGVKAVRRDSMSSSESQPETTAEDLVTTAQGVVYAVAPSERLRQQAKAKGKRWSKKR